ncbi:MAG TPA: PIN domain-containing protein [Jatrophihabitantaceae bacterium]
MNPSIGVTLDAGALIAVDRGDRRILELLARSRQVSGTVTVPATALAQAMRDPVRQVRLIRLVRQTTTKIVGLDRADAISVGRILARTRTSDIADAHIALTARRAGQAVVTSDADDLRRLDPRLRVVAV